MYDDLTKNETFVFISAYPDDYTVYKKTDEIADGLFIDIELVDWTLEENKNDDDYKEYIENFEKEIEKCKDYLNNNKDEAIVLGIFEQLNYGDNENKEKEDFICKAFMKKDYYNNTYMNKVIEWEQQASIYTESMSSHLVSFLSDDAENEKDIKFEIQFPDGY